MFKLKRSLGLAALAALLILTTGCLSALSPALFELPSASGNLDAIARVMAQQGVSVARADEATGIVETQWESSGSSSDGTLWVSRYILTAAPGEHATRITVIMDLRTCEGRIGTNHFSSRVDGSSCTRLPQGSTPAFYQTQLDRFSEQIRTGLGGRPTAGTTP